MNSVCADAQAVGSRSRCIEYVLILLIPQARRHGADPLRAGLFHQDSPRRILNNGDLSGSLELEARE